MPTPPATDQLRDAARALARAIEPVVGQVYFAPECHTRYAKLGFSSSPGSSKDGVAFPDGPAYFTSRGSALGHAPAAGATPSSMPPKSGCDRPGCSMLTG